MSNGLYSVVAPPKVDTPDHPVPIRTTEQLMREARLQQPQNMGGPTPLHPPGGSTGVIASPGALQGPYVGRGPDQGPTPSHPPGGNGTPQGDLHQANRGRKRALNEGLPGDSVEKDSPPPSLQAPHPMLSQPRSYSLPHQQAPHPTLNPPRSYTLPHQQEPDPMLSRPRSHTQPHQQGPNPTLKRPRYSIRTERGRVVTNVF